ncbi:MAG: hypothetical protein KKF62_03240 [Bacteroidetes bacterium]|nr:hypothetical protein [Bacteroidota bacterium]MBU1117114.1 hypothetical protein [Bacteroidota bacterium]MBU1798645.1 hypothetical protein [Bacteroidota bacterium]
MKIFIDTANLKQIREAGEMGILDGVTTNPSLIAREIGSRDEILAEIAKIVNGPISGEVLALDYEGMVKEGQELASIHENIVVTVPFNVIEQLFRHPLTDLGFEKFLADSNK